jgi:hypothetical protein
MMPTWGPVNGVKPQGLDGDGQQGDGLLLARGQQNVHFPLVGRICDFPGQFDKIVGSVTRSRHHHHHLVTGGVRLDNAA